MGEPEEEVLVLCNLLLLDDLLVEKQLAQYNRSLVVGTYINNGNLLINNIFKPCLCDEPYL